jgi:hypothetical protein
MRENAMIVEGDEPLELVDALKDEFSAVEFLSRSGSVGVLLFERYYLRIDSDVIAMVAFDLEDDNHCRVDMTVTSGRSTDVGAWNSMSEVIRNSIKRFADQNGLKLEETDPQFKMLHSMLYGPTHGKFLKKCIKCGKQIPIASEECEYCGAHQAHKK